MSKKLVAFAESTALLIVNVTQTARSAIYSIYYSPARRNRYIDISTVIMS